MTNLDLRSSFLPVSVLSLLISTLASCGGGSTDGPQQELDTDVQFESSELTVPEGIGSVAIRVRLSRPAAERVVVQVSASGRTAALATLPSELVFVAGETQSDLTLVVQDDALFEADASVRLELTSASGADIGATSSFELTVGDDDPAPQVQFSSATESWSEADGARIFTAELSAPAGVDFVVPVTVDGSATADDFSVGSQFTFPAGQTSATLSCSIIDDLLDEDDETVTVTFGPQDGPVVGASSTSTATISDNDAAPSVSVQSPISILESDGELQFLVALSAPSGRHVTVPFAIGGSVEAGLDYTAVSGPLTFLPGEVQQVIAVQLLDDDELEGTEEILVALGAPTNATLGGTPAPVQVLDNDTPPSVAFTTAQTATTEDAGSVSIALELSHPSSLPAQVTLVFGGDATAGADYIQPAATIDFAAGETSANVEIGLIDDAEVEAQETVTLTLTAPVDATLGATTLHTLMIEANDDVVVVTPASDDFNAFGIDGDVWEFVDPLNDAIVDIVGTNTSDARLSISIPSGTEHNAWTTLTAPRLRQQVEDEDFSIEVKFESVMSERYQEQGLIIEADEDNFIRFDFYHDGGTNNVYAGTIIGDVPTTRLDATISAPGATWMRVERNGDTWTQTFSTNGVDWLPGATFDQALAVQTVGVFASNAPGNSGVPAHVVEVDYFLNAAQPIANEDGAAVVDDVAPFIYGLGVNPNPDSLLVTLTADEPASVRLDYGLTESYELGSVSKAAFAEKQVIRVGDLDVSTNYFYRLVAVDVLGNEREVTGSETTTGADANGRPLIDLWYGHEQNVGLVGVPQTAFNLLGNVSDADGIYYISYSLNGADPVYLSLGPDLRRLENPGDFCIDVQLDQLLEGANEFLLHAVDNLGNETFDLVTVQRTVGNVWPQDVVVDWTTADNVNDLGQVVDGKWELNGNSVRNTEPGYDRLLAIGDVTWTDYEVEASVVVNSLVPTYAYPSNPGPSVGFLLRWQTHTDTGTQPDYGYRPFGGIGVYQWYEDGTERLEIQGDDTLDGVDTSGKTLPIGVPFMLKMRVTTTESEGGLYQMKMWQQGTPEPLEWDVEATGGADDLTSGSLLLLLHHADATFGAVTVTAL